MHESSLKNIQLKNYLQTPVFDRRGPPLTVIYQYNTVKFNTNSAYSVTLLDSSHKSNNALD